ncbi:MAG: tryptophan 7-halogenase [Hyphomonadaceae bacterium]|nr:tryptophan 7-halogenase [Hyphomonadaceae bacterium]
MSPLPASQFDLFVVGDGVAAWMAALLMKRLQPGRAIGIAACDAAGPGRDDPVLVARPGFRALMARLGISEIDLLEQCDATFLLGTEHHLGGGGAFFQGCGAYGAPANGAAFHHYFLRLRTAGAPYPYDTFSLGAAMASQGKFIHPADNPRALESSFDYGHVIETARFRDLLSQTALSAGVVRTGAPVSEAIFTEGRIGSLQLEDGGHLEAGFYLDCSGPARTLWPDNPIQVLGPALLSQTARVDRAEQGSGNLSRALSTAGPSGWTSELALQSARVCQTFELADSEEANAHHLAAPWAGNCLALGRAAHRLSPVHTPFLALLERELDLLSALLPAEPGACEVEAREYNRRINETYARVHDFQTLFEIAIATRAGKSASAPSAPLARKLEQFRSRGRMVMYDEEVFSESEWTAALIGLGHLPERTSPLASAAPIAAVRANYEKLLHKIGQSTARMPDQLAYIAHMQKMMRESGGVDAV